MRDLHIFREQFGPKLKRGADEETVQDASAERTATGLPRWPRRKQRKPTKANVCGVDSGVNVTAKLGNHFPAGEVVRVIQADENPNVWRKDIWIPRQCYKPDGKRVHLHIGADSLLS